MRCSWACTDCVVTFVLREHPGADPAAAVTKVTRYRYDGEGRLTAILRERDGQEQGSQRSKHGSNHGVKLYQSSICSYF